MRLAVLIGIIVGAIGCRANVPTPKAEPETVGSLAPSYNSIAVAPIHHDEPPVMGQVVDSGDSMPETIAPILTVPPPQSDTPDKVEKASHGF
jgi:hypothetical protein